MTARSGSEDSILVIEITTTSGVRDAETFARAVIFAICNASVTARVGRRTYERCLRALAGGATVRLGLRHTGKANAIDLIWRERHKFHREYLASADKPAFLATLPWVGPVTGSALALELGLISPPTPHERRAAA